MSRILRKGLRRGSQILRLELLYRNPFSIFSLLESIHELNESAGSNKRPVGSNDILHRIRRCVFSTAKNSHVTHRENVP